MQTQGWTSNELAASAKYGASPIRAVDQREHQQQIREAIELSRNALQVVNLQLAYVRAELDAFCR